MMRKNAIMAEHGRVIAGGLVLLVLGVLVGFIARGTSTNEGQAAKGTAGGLDTVTQRLVLQSVTGLPIPCGSAVSGIGDVIVTGYATSSKARQVQFRVGYGVNGGNEAWYDNHYEQLPAAAETLVLNEVQDIDVGVTSATFTLNSVGYTKLSCTIGVSNVLNPSEGVTSTRPLVTGELVDQVRITATEYATGKPITCGDVTTNHLSRVRYVIEFFSDIGVWASVHTHVENPGKTGPDQNLDGLNNRWWEFTTPQLKWVPANTWTRMAEVTTANNPGVNVIHASEASQPDDRKIETFCTYRV